MHTFHAPGSCIALFSKKTRSQKLTVKGGFYSREDMKTELGYSLHLGGTDLNPYEHEHAAKDIILLNAPLWSPGSALTRS